RRPRRYSSRVGRQTLVRSRGMSRAAPLALAKEALASSTEKARVALRRLGGGCALKLANARVRPFKRFVLHQHCLYKRVRRVGGLAQTVPDQAFRLGIALRVLQRCQAVEQFDDEIAFLWSHWSVSFPLTTPSM